MRRAAARAGHDDAAAASRRSRAASSAIGCASAAPGAATRVRRLARLRRPSGVDLAVRGTRMLQAAADCAAAPRQQQRAVERIARRRARVLPDDRRQARPSMWPPGRRSAPGAARRARPAAPPSHRYGRRQAASSLDRGRIVARRMLDHERRKRAEVARRRLRGPVHDGVRIALELLEHGAQQRGPCDAAVMRPQARGARPRGRARRRCPRRRPASPSRRRDAAGRASTAQPMLPVPTTMTPPSRAAMRADAGRMRVRGQDGPAERMLCCARRSELGRLARARQRQAGGDARQIVGRRAAPAQAVPAWRRSTAAKACSRPSRILAGPPAPRRAVSRRRRTAAPGSRFHRRRRRGTERSPSSCLVPFRIVRIGE